MGSVIPLQEVRSASVTAMPVMDFIDQAYAKLAALPGFRVRDGQKDLSRAVCDAMVANEPIAAEAPTGTGKTLSYLIGALAAAKILQTVKEIPVVIATATVGLQQQILSGDLPKLIEAGLVEDGDSVLAKGRGRYMCTMAAERLVDDGPDGSQLDLIDTDKNAEVAATKEVRDMLDQYFGRQWDGDSDTYTGLPPMAWAEISASADTCVGRKCPHFEKHCAFFKARAQLAHARVIVANHDLVLSDLAMSKAEQDPLFPAGRYLLVFDEAHNLPDKAIEAGSAHAELPGTAAELNSLSVVWRTLSKHVELVKLMVKHGVEEGDFEPSGVVGAIANLSAVISRVEVDPESRQARFPGGDIPLDIREAAEYALVHIKRTAETLAEATKQLKATNLTEKIQSLTPLVAEVLFHLSFFSGQVKTVHQALNLFLDKERAVRWVFHNEHTASLHVAPVEGADVLKKLLWGNPRAVTALLSATLKDFDGYERFRARAGTPDNLRTMALPHIFPYGNSTMGIVDMDNSPKQETRADYEAELKLLLPTSIVETEGTLILFPSAKLMKEVAPTLRKHFGTRVLTQGSAGIKELIQVHKARVDDGTGSILCGLATMAEGLDLPGKYCTHVVICTLPFAVPTSPVELELQEILGARYFAERALPDSLIKLIQMVGRLMRRESDIGRLTVFDKRLMYSKWGRKLLGALPPFRIRRLEPTLLAREAQRMLVKVREAFP